MSKMIVCKTCKTEIASDAKNCPKCGAPNKKKGCMTLILYGFAGLLVLSVIGAVVGGDNDDSGSGASASASQSTSNSTPAKPIAIGDVVTTPKFKVTVVEATLRQSIGSDMFASRASDGATYVAIQWEYTNASGKPIPAFGVPSIHLRDPNGNKYDPDVGAGAAYATELDLNEKVLSNVNPGIRIKAADVFEVSKEQLARNGWRILIRADRDIVIPIQAGN